MVTDDSYILVDIDALYDTRLATLKGIDDSYVDRVLKAGYRDRITDNFAEFIPEIDMDLYNKLYRNRDIATLVTAAAFPTMMILHLALVVREHIKMASEGPMSGIPTVCINTYPYDLTPEEKKVITKGIYGDIDEVLCQVTTVRLSPEQMSPTAIKSRYKVLFIYDLSGWMKLHEADIRVNAPIDIVTFSPKRFITGNLNSLPDFSQYKDIDISNLAGELYTEYFRMVLTDMAWFSYRDNNRLREFIHSGKKK